MRGLPHCHLLVTLADVDKPNDARKVDSLISAEIPDPVQESGVYERVKAHMVTNEACAKIFNCLFRFTALVVPTCVLARRANATRSFQRTFESTLTWKSMYVLFTGV